ncbi:hypothetical protein KJ586_01785 [Patescibacteria group bacterium]|nr:hypothetical protein [Patescibacteria group bacterium]
MNKKNKILLFLATSFLIIVFTPSAGRFYEMIIGRKITTWFWGLSHPEYIEGFFVSYMFFVSLFVILFGGKKKYKIGGILLGFLLFIDVALGAWEGLIIDIGAILIGWLLAQGILLIRKKSQ